MFDLGLLRCSYFKQAAWFHYEDDQITNIEKLSISAGAVGIPLD